MRRRGRYRSACFHHRFRGPARRDGEPLDVPNWPAGSRRRWTRTRRRRRCSTGCARALTRVARTSTRAATTSSACGAPSRSASIETEQALLLGHPLHPTPKGLGGPARPLRARAAAALPAALALGRRRARRARQRDRHARPGAGRAAARQRRAGRPHPAPRPPVGGRLPGARRGASCSRRGDVIDLGPRRRAGHADDLGADRLPRRLAVPAEVLAARARDELDAGDAAEGAAARGRGGAAGADARSARPRGASRPASRSSTTPRTCRSRARTASRVLLRENRWPAGATCARSPCSARTTRSAAAAGSRTSSARWPRADEAEVAREWFARYCDVVDRLARSGSTWTSACASSRTSRTRCSSSTAAGRSAAWSATARATSTARPRTTTSCTVIPELGEASESIFPEALADERLVYYPFVNNALGVIDALGAGGCIDERVLLGDLRDAAGARARPRRPLPAHAARPPARRRRAGRARPTCARACTTWTSSSATSRRSPST